MKAEERRTYDGEDSVRDRKWEHSIQKQQNLAVDVHLENYFRRFYRIVTGRGELQSVGFLLLNADNKQLLLLGTAETVESYNRLGLHTGTIWNEETVGSCAVVRGMSSRSECMTRGTENGSFLQDKAIYFCPLQLNHPERTEELNLDGGIAILVPEEQASPGYRFMASSIAHDLVMNLHFRWVSDKLFNRSGGGVICVDTEMKNGEAVITSCNEALFQILGIEGKPIDYVSKPLFTFLDNTHINRRFMEALKQGEPFEDRRMTISVKGRKILCIISADCFVQEALHVRSMTFYITTDQQISGNIARRTMNSALLTFEDIVGDSTMIRAAIHRARQVAATDSNVLITGESGVGKDVFAQAIHNESLRRNGPFVAVNCAALPRELIASELFGYDEGAFTGAKKGGNIGKFELANGGTIFLDEIGDLPLDLQGVLLRIVEQKQFSRLGSSRTIQADTRIISATNADLLSLVKEKRFREDLYYRLSTMNVSLPPLREREDDVILLTEYFLKRICTRTGRAEEMELTESSRELLRSLPFPGNIRELQNLMECISQMYSDSYVLPEHILNSIPPAEKNQYSERLSDKTKQEYPYINYDLPTFVPGSYRAWQKEEAGPYGVRIPVRHVQLDAAQITEAIERCGNNKTAAAWYLGVSIRTLYRKMKQLKMI